MKRFSIRLLFGLILIPFLASLAEVPQGTRINFGYRISLSSDAVAALTAKGEVNGDGTIDTEHPGGDKPTTGSSCSTWTAATKGDAALDCEEVSETALTLTCSGTNDQGNICYAYRTATTASDLQIEAVIPAEWTGHLENFTAFGVFISEGGGDDDYSFQVSWPNIGTMRSKVWDGTAVQQNGAPGQFLARAPVATYDLSATDLQGWGCDSTVTDCFAIGTATDKTLTFPVRYGVFGTSHDSGATTTAALTGIAFSTTIDVADEEPPLPTGSDFVVDSDAEFDCQDEGVEPGDTVTIPGGTRGNLLIDRCIGDAGNPITIRHDSTDTERAVISGTGDVFEIRNSEYITIDGTAGWIGGPSGTCSGLSPETWPDIGAGGNCGILVERASGDVLWLMKHLGRARNFTVKGVEIDGTGDPSGSGIGWSTNDNSYTISENPDEWRENIIFEDNYIHDTRSEGMYFGTNFSQTDAMKLRNIEIRYNTAHDCGSECLNGKTWFDGTNLIHHNHMHGSGVTTPGLGTDIIQINDGHADVYNNLLYDAVGACLQVTTNNTPSEYGPLTIRLYNNVTYDCGEEGIRAGHTSPAGSADGTALVYSNTVVDAAQPIVINNATTNATVCNNIVAGSVTTITTGSGHIDVNNRRGTVASQAFAGASSDDFSLTEDSPAVDGGLDSDNCMPDDDFLGTLRPQGGIPDQGAYEYDPTAPPLVSRDVWFEGGFETGSINPNGEAVDGFFIHTLPITQVGSESFSTGSGCCSSTNTLDTRVIQSRTPPNTGDGAPTEGAVDPRAGTYYLENAIYLTKDYTELTSGSDRPRTKFFPNQFGMEFDEEFYLSFSVYLPSNLEIEPSGGGRTSLLGVNTDSNGTQFSIQLSAPEVGTTKWALMAQTTDGSIIESGVTDFDIDLGLISEDLGHWTDFIIRYRPNPFASGQGYDCPVNPVTDLSVSGAKSQSYACDVGILQVWKSVGSEDVNGDRQMRRMFSRVNLPVGLVPNATLPIKFNIQTYKPNGKVTSLIDGPMWIPFDEIYFGKVIEHGTGFDDVHPTQKTCATIAETPADCP